ncbi:unnamed protein product [Urochloa humidicola]
MPGSEGQRGSEEEQNSGGKAEDLFTRPGLRQATLGSSSSTSRTELPEATAALQAAMAWLQSLFSPLKKLWVRMHSAQHKKRGIYILYEDVKSCPCEDVQILWSILVESHSHPPPLRLKH